MSFSGQYISSNMNPRGIVLLPRKTLCNIRILFRNYKPLIYKCFEIIKGKKILFKKY